MKKSVIAFGAAALAVLALACSSNEAKSFMPKASELCCHSNWDLLGSGEDAQEGECADWHKALFPGHRSCWNRLYVNTKIRPGEPDDIQILLAVLESSEQAEQWLPGYEQSGGWDPADYSEEFDPLIGDGARAWDYSSGDPPATGTEAAFYQGNLAVVVFVGEGSSEQRRVMLESVDQALVDRIYGYE